MKLSRRRIRAIVVKEIRDYRRNRSALFAMALLPIIFLVNPLVTVFVLKSSEAAGLAHRHTLLYLLAIPALVPAALAAASIVSERQQGTLEPVLTTPIRREEFVVAKALAPLIPSVGVAYLVYGLFLVLVELFARPGVAPAIIHGPDILAQVIFSPLIATWSIWLALAISARVSDIRVAQQASVLVSLPSVAVSTLVAANVIHPTLRLALGLGIGLLVLDRLGWRIVSRMFDRERLVTGTKA
jgi:ABC-2 type transport system permease protein